MALEPCAGAILKGDGRELWKFQSDGQISNVAGKKCIALDENVVTSGGFVSIGACDAVLEVDGRSQWEQQGNGQLKLRRQGQFCLSQRGPAPGVENVAANVAVMATSTADVVAHGTSASASSRSQRSCSITFSFEGATMAVDGKDATFWASKLDDVDSPVVLTIDIGSVKTLEHAEIEWEFPAKSFALDLSVDGVQWSEVYSTDTNVVKSLTVPLGYQHATKARLVMREVSCGLCTARVCSFAVCFAAASDIWAVQGSCALWYQVCGTFCANATDRCGRLRESGEEQRCAG